MKHLVKDNRVIKGNSMSDKTFNIVKERCPSIDFLFIDGGHDYNNVINDFDRYSKLVSPGGLIVFDDYLMFERPNPFTDVEKRRKGQVRLAVDDIVSKLSKDNIIGILPNIAGAISYLEPPKFDYNISYIIQKK
jgi:predicted O-methyltransferase YrrM